MLVRFERRPLNRPLANDLFGLERGIDSVFREFFANPWAVGPRGEPSIDVSEHGNEMVVVAELAGVKKEDLKLTVHDGVLTIAGERKASGLPENSRWLRNETVAGAFSRSIELPHSVKPEAITAELTDGILKVILPTAEEAQVREITVK